MSRRALVPVLVAAVGLAAPVIVQAAPKPKPPITKSYKAAAFPMDPSPFATSGGICRNQVEQSLHVHEFSAPAAGSIQIDMTGFTGDWDLALRSDKDAQLADSAQDMTSEPIDRPEKIKYKLKKAMKLRIVACNFLGGPEATVKYTFTYA